MAIGSQRQKTESAGSPLPSPGSRTGHYRVDKLLDSLEDMSFATAQSPLFNLPVTTRFTREDQQLEGLKEVMQEVRKERDVIQHQPYRTTQLVFPNPKPKPDVVKPKPIGVRGGMRPFDQKMVIANLGENQALVQRQAYNNPRSLYSDQNYKEAIYVQTGVDVHHPQQPASQHMQPSPRSASQHMMPSPRSASQLSNPIHLKPDTLPAYQPQNSPTFRAILEEEGPGVHMGPVVGDVRQQRPVHSVVAAAAPPQGGRLGHATAPSGIQINSVGMPTERIAQSSSFKRLMWNVMGEM